MTDVTKIERAIKTAAFRYKASLEEVDYAIDRGLDKNQLHRLAGLDFIKEHKDISITGSWCILLIGLADSLASTRTDGLT